MSEFEDPKHVVTIAVDQEMVSLAEENGETVDLSDPEFWAIRLRCEEDRDDFTRSCLMWQECKCILDEDTRDELRRDGEGPCPESLTGVHTDSVGDLSPAIPTREC